MINTYLVDEINIITYNKDRFGAITPSAQTAIPAYIEDNNRIVRNIKGEEVTGSMVVMIDDSVDITYTDIIRIKKRNGVNIDINDKDFGILNLAKRHGFSGSHWEITI